MNLPTYAEMVDFRKPFKAAYFGETEILKDDNGELKDIYKVHSRPSVIINMAMAGGQKEFVKTVLECGWPRYTSDLQDVFTSEHLTPEMAKIFIDNIPDFKEKHGNRCLVWAIGSQNIDVVQEIVQAGVSVNDVRYSPLATAIKIRDENIVKLLIKNGADPYISSGGRRPVDIALQLNSYDMLEIVDTKGEFNTIQNELEKTLPEENSMFIGLWMYKPSGGGFGTIALNLLKDGSGAMMGALPCVWKKVDNKTIHIEPVPELIKQYGDEAKNMIFDLQMNDQDELISTDKKEMKRLKRQDIANLQKSDWKYPVYIRLENVWIDPKEDMLIIQINGKRRSVPMKQLLNGAEQSANHTKPNKDNVVTWESFQPIDSKIVPDEWIEINLASKQVSPGYSPKHTRLGYNHNELVDLPENEERMLFKLTGSKRYHNGDLSPYGHEVEGWALMQHDLFPHGTDWVIFYFQKSDYNDAISGSPSEKSEHAIKDDRKKACLESTDAVGVLEPTFAVINESTDAIKKNGRKIWLALYLDNLERDQGGDYNVWPEKSLKIKDSDGNLQTYSTSTEYFKFCSRLGVFAGVSPASLSLPGFPSATGWSDDCKVKFEADNNMWCVVLPKQASKFLPKTPLFFTKNFCAEGCSTGTIDQVTKLYEGVAPFGDEMGCIITYDGKIKIITSEQVKSGLQKEFNPLGQDFEFIVP